MAGASWSQVFRYKFDNFMARGGSSIFMVLVVVFLGLWISLTVVRGVFVAALPNSVVVERHGDIDENELGTGAKVLRGGWLTFLQLTDPGNMAQDIESSALYKVFAIISGIAGVILAGSLIAFITTALDQKIAELRKGHSRVVEEDHTLILGWNERIIEILRELVLANESEDNPCVVILSQQDKEFMDDYIALHLHDSLNTRIVTRSGAESSLVNLEIASVENCRSCIILATCGAGAPKEQKMRSDTVATKTILAVMASRESSELPIVAEIFHERNREIISQVSELVVAVDTDEILAKILVQTSRSVGLSVVYGEMLSFDGCELYFHGADWGDVSFGELAYRFPDGVPMGIRRASGDLLVNASIDTRLEEGDEILILAEDDSTIEYRSSPVARPRELTLAGGRLERTIERELLIGWTPKVETIIREYADYVLAGSSIDLMLREADDTVRDKISALDEELSGVTLRLVDADPLQTSDLLSVNPWEYDNIIILSQSSADGDDERVDSETIIILLMLRKIFDSRDDEDRKPRLITEVLDSENQELIARSGVNDFIISNRFVSMILAQISEDPDVKRVYDDLFEEDGSEIYLKPASLYFSDFPVEATYADMIHVAQQREEVCLGVKLIRHEQTMEENFGVKLIPEKTQSYTLGPDDTLVVLAEDET